jgi:hypothetical protein
MFGKKLQKPPDASGWPEEAGVLFVILYPLILYTGITRYSRSLYMRKKFDKEDPSSGSSIWTERILLIFGLYFAVGTLVGAVFLWNIMLFLSTGMVLPRPTVLGTMVSSGWVLFLITVEFIEWRSHHRLYQIPEQDLEEDDSCFLV